MPNCRWLLILPLEEEEVEAMEMVLRHCYEGHRCDAGDDKCSVSQLLRMIVLADRWVELMSILRLTHGGLHDTWLPGRRDLGDAVRLHENCHHHARRGATRLQMTQCGLGSNHNSVRWEGACCIAASTSLCDAHSHGIQGTSSCSCDAEGMASVMRMQTGDWDAEAQGFFATITH